MDNTETQATLGTKHRELSQIKQQKTTHQTKKMSNG